MNINVIVNNRLLRRSIIIKKKIKIKTIK